ncbi:MAG: Rpn family recombination-promoting nuclease/putative transposase, partial [Hydrogenobaculum sp.]
MKEKENLPEHLKDIEELRNIQSSDALFKLIMKNPDNIKTFLQAYEPTLAKHLDLENIRVLDTEKYNTIEGKKKHLDLAFEVDIKGTDEKIELYFIVEHKSNPDKGIFLQLLSYIYAKYEEAYRENKDFPNIVPIVLYVGKEEWNIPTSTVKGLPIDEEIKDYLFNLSYTLKTPKEMDPEKVEAIRKDIELYAY